MNETTFTVKVIAGKLEVSKPTVQRAIEALEIEPVKTKGQTRFYSALDAARIADSLGKTKPPTANHQAETDAEQNRQTDTNRNKTETENAQKGQKPPQNEDANRQTANNDSAVIEILREQLKAKDEQIARLFESLNLAQHMQSTAEKRLALLESRQSAPEPQEAPEPTEDDREPIEAEDAPQAATEATATTHTETAKDDENEALRQRVAELEQRLAEAEQPQPRRGFFARLFGR